MATSVAPVLRPAPFPRADAIRHDPAQQAFLLLRIGLTVFPIVMGLDKFAGLVVAFAPRAGALLVAGWLAGIIVDLLIVGGYGDVAFRDFGLMLTALTLFRLSALPVARR